MHRYPVFLICAVIQVLAWAEVPSYTASSIQNAGNGEPGQVAPYTVVSLIGKHLAYTTKTVEGLEDAVRVPYRLPGAGVTVAVNGIPAGLFYVSPEELRFLVSSIHPPGKMKVRVVREGVAGPDVELPLKAIAPAILQSDPDYAQVFREDGTQATHENRARPGELLAVIATGLGKADSMPGDRVIPRRRSSLVRIREFCVELQGNALPPEAIEYAGLEPGAPGAYRIEFRLPDDLPLDPDIQVGFEEAMSQRTRIPAEGIRRAE